MLCPSDVPTLRFASQLFVDSASGAVLLLLRHRNFVPDTLFSSDVLVRRLASLLFVDSASVAVSLLIFLTLCKFLTLSTGLLNRFRILFKARGLLTTAPHGFRFEFIRESP